MKESMHHSGPDDKTYQLILIILAERTQVDLQVEVQVLILSNKFMIDEVNEHS